MLQVTTAVIVNRGWTLVPPAPVISAPGALPMETTSPATVLQVVWIQIASGCRVALATEMY